MANKLNSIINDLPGHPPFKSQDFLIGNETLRFHFRDIVPCICAIFGDPEFARDLVFAPEQYYVVHEQTCQVYSEMYTGDWWWSKQVHDMKSFWFLYWQMELGITWITAIWCNCGATHCIHRQNAANCLWWEDGVPSVYDDWKHPKGDLAEAIAVRSNAHQLYPYNQAKGHSKQGCRSCMLVNLFHSCMWIVLGPIALHGETGLEMMSRDRIWHQCHPILSNFIGDYPEECLVTFTYYGECPKCQVPCDQLGD